MEGLCKRTPKSSSVVKRDLHGLGWVQTESEKSKANKLTHRHTHAFRANIEKQNISDNYKVNKHCGINYVLRECSHAVVAPVAAQRPTLDLGCVLLKMAQTNAISVTVHRRYTLLSEDSANFQI